MNYTENDPRQIFNLNLILRKFFKKMRKLKKFSLKTKYKYKMFDYSNFTVMLEFIKNCFENVMNYSKSVTAITF